MTAPNTHINVSGTWKNVNKMYVKVSGTWKEVTKAYVKVAGVWKQVHEGVVPGSTTYSTPGTYNFVVPKHNTLTVQLWGAGGGGGGAGAAVTGYGGTNEIGGTGGPSKWDGGSASGKPQANGGVGGRNTETGTGGAGGTASGGTTNTSGGAGGDGGTGSGGAAGTAANGGYGDGGPGEHWTQVVYVVTHYYAGGGGGGAYSSRSYSAGTYAVGATVSVVVGAAGSPYYGSTAPDNGRVTISWS